MSETNRAYQPPTYPGVSPSGATGTFTTPFSTMYPTSAPAAYPAESPLYGTSFPTSPAGYDTAYPSGPSAYSGYCHPIAGCLADCQFALMQVRPWVDYALREAQKTGYRHAFMEAALITYLIGMGYDPATAHNLVESWEMYETFPAE